MFEYGSVGIIYSSVLFAFLSAARYWLYKDKLRIHEKPMYIIVGLISLLSGGLWLLTGGIPGISYDIYRIIFSVLMLSLSLVIIKVPLAENVFSYAFILAFVSSVETTASYIRLNFFENANVYIYPVISSVIVAISFVPLVRSLKKMIIRLGELGTDRIWSWLDLACYSFLFMNLVLTRPHPSNMNLFYPLGRYLTLVGMIGIYNAVIRMMDIMRAAANARAELSLSQRRLSLQQSFYDRVKLQMDEVRRQRHDLRHHRAVISSLIKNGDISALSNYMNATTEIEESLPVTGNLTADSILLYYRDIAAALSVKTETAVSIGRDIPVSDPDLCVVLGNLLENAVDAQKYLAPEDRFIRITAKADKTRLTLAVDNRFDGVLNTDNGVYLSRKEGAGHGLGLASVKAICEKYNGILQLDADNGMFMAGVVIGI